MAVLVSACASFGPSEPVVPDEQREAYNAALGNLPANPDAADRALRSFLETWPQSPLADDAGEQLARLAAADDRREDVFRWLYFVVNEHGRGDRADSVRLRLARLELERNRIQDARGLLAKLRLDKLTAPERRRAYRLLVVLAETDPERLTLLADLRGAVLAEAIRREKDGDQASADRLRENLRSIDGEIDDLIASSTAEELETAFDGVRRRVPGARVQLELARRAAEAGDLESAARRAERARRIPHEDAVEALILAFLDRLTTYEELASGEARLPSFAAVADEPVPPTDGAVGTLGVVLPLSGRFAPFGSESLKAVLLATGIFDPAPVSDASSASSGQPRPVLGDPTGPDSGGRFGEESDRGRAPLRLRVRDSRGEADLAAEAVRELAADRDLVAVIGPIFKGESLAAAEVAQQVGVPLVTLSARDDVPEDRSQVFRVGRTPSDEVGFLVEYAVEKLGARRFAVLYPDSTYGRGMRRLYWEAVREHEGTIVAAASYDPETTDHSESIRSLIGYSLLTAKEEQALRARERLLRSARRLEPEQAAVVREVAYEILGPEGQPLPPIVDFDAIFIPDSADKIALIAPELAFHEIVGPTPLGISEWYDDELLDIARNHVGGAVISTGFDPKSAYPFVSDFVSAYRATYLEEPGSYAAQAFDATNLLLVQLAAGRGDRDEVRDGLLGARGYPGASGILTMRPDGNTRRRPFILGVQQGRFKPLD